MFNKLKDAVRRSSLLLGVAVLLGGLGATAIPAFASADDTLNPLTDRSLTLSSSSPGWSYTDGSGNSTYAPPNSGSNGKQTGNTFTFDASSTSSINAFSFQYCTSAAGNCTSPGTDGYTQTGGALTTCQTASTPDCTRASDSTTTSDLNVVTGTSAGAPAEISSATYSAITSTLPNTRGTGCYDNYVNTSSTPTDCEASTTNEFPGQPKTDNTEGNFAVLIGGSYSANWVMGTENLETDGTHNTVGDGTGETGAQNMIVLQNTGVTPPTITGGEAVKIVFYGNTDNYITNPGAGAFFVKINDYDDSNITSGTPVTLAGDDDTNFGPSPTDNDIVDGGVTVANVMNLSIEIQTKVLETMDFSVGTVDPDTLSSGQLTADGDSGWGQCLPILPAFTTSGSPAQNTLILGNENAENSLMTEDASATHSYWRLSSNSSGGATVYYAGDTLSNTEGNQIDPTGLTAAHSVDGTEQFGLGLDVSGSSYGTGGIDQPDYSVANNDSASSIKMEDGVDTDLGVNTPGTGGASPTAGTFGLSSDFTTYQAANSAAVHDPQLYPLVPETGYGGASGGINGATTADGNTNATFSFSPTANTIPTPIASESSQVVNCVTGKVRYLGNIAATTAAGIYTTKINYVAAPEY